MFRAEAYAGQEKGGIQMEEAVEALGLADRRCLQLFLISKGLLPAGRPACARRQPMPSRLSLRRKWSAVAGADSDGLPPGFGSLHRIAFGLGMASAPALFFGFESLMFVRKEA
ncbi:hypothetical protein VE23_22600 [Paenibacillus sp. D9]|nr:hypothetical protein VE23_22600 [Paenibacillus sp. D9]